MGNCPYHLARSYYFVVQGVNEMFKQKICALLIGTGIVAAAMLIVQTPYLLWTLMTMWLAFAIYVGRYPNEAH